MAPKKKKMPAPKRAANITAEIENAGVVMEQPITQTLETNFMPYAMSVIISRAIPEIDGFFENVWRSFRENGNVY